MSEHFNLASNLQFKHKGINNDSTQQKQKEQNQEAFGLTTSHYNPPKNMTMIRTQKYIFELFR